MTTINGAVPAGEMPKPQDEKTAQTEKAGKEPVNWSVFLQDGVLSVDEQTQVLNEAVNSNQTIQQAVKEGFSLNNLLTQAVNQLRDITVNTNVTEAVEHAKAKCRAFVSKCVEYVEGFAKDFLQVKESESTDDTTDVTISENINPAGYKVTDINIPVKASAIADAAVLPTIDGKTIKLTNEELMRFCPNLDIEEGEYTINDIAEKLSLPVKTLENFSNLSPEEKIKIVDKLNTDQRNLLALAVNKMVEQD